MVPVAPVPEFDVAVEAPVPAAAFKADAKFPELELDQSLAPAHCVMPLAGLDPPKLKLRFLGL